jgi:hypothetical protein
VHHPAQFKKQHSKMLDVIFVRSDDEDYALNFFKALSEVGVQLGIA